jgi:hypothetical protein
MFCEYVQGRCFIIFIDRRVLLRNILFIICMRILYNFLLSLYLDIDNFPHAVTFLLYHVAKCIMLRSVTAQRRPVFAPILRIVFP